MSGKSGTIEVPIIDSKGCGGVMRVAPIGLYFDSRRRSPDAIAMIGAETAALTHGHELGYIPAAALVHMISTLSHSDGVRLEDAVTEALNASRRLFAKAKHIDAFSRLMDKAVALSKEDADDLEAIRELGESWVAEETLAIAVYCALKHQNDFERAIIAAVNHSGDSDSTGSVTGNILCAHLGVDAIPDRYLENLELRDVIAEIARDLFNDCRISEYGAYQDEVWVQKYVYHSYVPSRA